MFHQAGVSQPEGKIPTIPVRAEQTVIHLLLMAAVLLCPESTASELMCVCVCVSAGDRVNDAGAQMEFKSKQWFGASVRSDGEHILVTHTHTHTHSDTVLCIMYDTVAYITLTCTL